MLTQPAFAYVGPGLGLGTLGVILGVIVSVLLAIVGIVWYPMKRLVRRMRAKGSAPIEEQGSVPKQNAPSKEQPTGPEHKAQTEEQRTALEQDT
jgi:hypothetical protein